MFKKGKKKQDNKVALDFGDLGDSKENTGEAENAETTNLREEIAKIKSNKGKSSKPATAVSFEEDTADDDFIHTKKPLFNAETMNTEPEEAKVPTVQAADVKKYNRDYLEELRKQNARQNESAREMMQNIQTLTDLGHMEEEIVENQAAQKMEEEKIEEEEEDEDHMDEAQIKEIEKAKEYRERKRKQDTGDFISLKTNEREQEVGPTYNKDRALQNIFKDEGESKEKRKFYQEMEDEESDEEFRKLEASIVKQNVNKKALKNINKFVKNTYGQGSDDEGRGKEELKMLTYEVDMDYVMKCVQESLKTDEAKFADNIERAEKLEKLIAVSEDSIQNYQREYDHNAASLEIFQEVADYMNDISDCLGEKNREIEEGENVLRQLEENYSDIRFTRYQFDVSDQLEENGGQPIEFYDDNLNHKRKTEKNFRLMRRLENDRPIQVGGKIEYILDGINQETLTLRRDEDLTNLKVDKAALYLAGKDIFKDVVEEYTSIDIIVSRFYELKDKYIAEEPKVLDWLAEALVPFATIDLIGYDPLGYTDVEHEFHKKIEFTELPFFKELSNIQKSYESDTQKEIQDKNSFMKKLIFYIQEKCVKKRLKEIIEFHWDPFSTEETKNLAAALNLFIEVYYRPNKTKQHLETLQDLLLSVTKKLKDYLNILIFPPRVDSKFGYDMVVLCTKFIINIIALKGILPDRHIIQIGITTVFFTNVIEAIKSFSEYEQVILISKILEYIPANILASEDVKSNFDSLKLHLNKIIPYITGKSASFNIPEKYVEPVNQALSHVGQTLKISF